MKQGIFDTTDLNQKELKNPPKYIEDIENFKKVFNRKQSSENEINSVLTKLEERKKTYEDGLYSLESDIQSNHKKIQAHSLSLTKELNRIIDLENEAFIAMESTEDLVENDYYYGLFIQYRAEADALESVIKKEKKRTGVTESIAKKFKEYKRRIKVIDSYISRLKTQVDKGYIVRPLERKVRDLKETRHDHPRKITIDGYEVVLTRPINFGDRFISSMKEIISDLFDKPRLKETDYKRFNKTQPVLFKKQIFVNVEFLADPTISEETKASMLIEDNQNRMYFGKKFDAINSKWLKKISKLKDFPLASKEGKLRTEQLKKYGKKREEYINEMSKRKSIPKRDENNITIFSTRRHGRKFINGKDVSKELIIQELSQTITAFQSKYILHGSFIRVHSFSLVESAVESMLIPVQAKEEDTRSYELEEIIDTPKKKNKNNKKKKVVK